MVTVIFFYSTQVHRVLMLASLFIGVVGVAMVFIGHAHEDNPKGLIELGSSNVSMVILYAMNHAN